MSIEMTSNKPYLVKAFYDWISDNQLTPYIVVDTTVNNVMVPMSFVQNGEIVLNISQGAVGAISLGEHAIEFSARFGGKLEHLFVPYGAIAAIYAKENGVGTALPVEQVDDALAEDEDEIEEINLSSVESTTKAEEPSSEADTKPPAKKRPSLKVVK
ncbi:ClpXP protease specificity-enhancing factor [Thalassotalea agariperforans]